MERQQAVCSRCLQRGHRVAECQNDVTCRACSESRHKRGDPTCSCQQPADRGKSGRAAGRVEQNHSAEQNQPSDAPDTWQSTGRCPIETAREKPGVRRCHPTRMLIGRSARRSERGSDQDHHHLPNLLCHLRSHPLRRQTDKQNRTMCKRGRDLSKTNDKKSKKPKAVKQTRMSLFTERRSRPPHSQAKPRRGFPS